MDGPLVMTLFAAHVQNVVVVGGKHVYDAVDFAFAAHGLQGKMFSAEQHAEIECHGLETQRYACGDQRQHHQGLHPCATPIKLIQTHGDQDHT